MIDIKILRTNPEVVRAAIVNKSAKVNLDDVIKLDAERLKLQQEVESLRARRNGLSDSMGKGKPDPALIAEAKEIKEQLAELEVAFEAAETAFFAEFKKVPNLPTEDTPIGLSEDENQVVRVWGKPTEFSFDPKNHAEIANARGWLDKERATKVAGARFAYLKGDLVKLQMALVNWVMNTLSDSSVLDSIIKEHGLKVSSKPFVPVLPPYMIRTEPYDAMDRLEPREDRYKIEGQDLWLQGSAEHVLGSMHADEIFAESEMPVRYLGYATSFRGEA